MTDDLKAKLLAPREQTASGMPEADVDVPGVGTVRVRGLSRLEAMWMQSAKGVQASERRLLSVGMVDPAMTESDVAQWQKVSTAGELEPVTQMIARLSGTLAGSAKEVVREFLENPDTEFRNVPGGEAVDDAEPAPGGDE